jgi:uncharacterized ion transporter superfamily protein YfcC
MPTSIKPSTHAHGSSSGSLNPIVMMIAVIIAAMLLTYIVGSGHFARQGGVVLPGSYQVMPKITGFQALFSSHVKTPKPDAKIASAAGLVAGFAAVPAGLIKNADLVFLVLLVGGMFGVLRATGALDAGVDRLIHITGGNKYVLIPVLMIVLGLGSTFLGFISEYLVVIPIVALVGERLGFDRIFAVAIVGIAAKIGYATSVTNPLALVVAQPLAHVPLFSGMGFRLALFGVFIAIGIGYALWVLKPVRPATAAAPEQTAHLSSRHLSVLLGLLAAGAAMVLGFVYGGWGESEVSTFYVFLSLAFAILGGLGAAAAADAFVTGLKSMMLAALLIGMAGSVQILLQNSFVLDTMIADATQILHGQSSFITANGLMAIEMFLGVLIPSTAGKVAVSMPILAPIAQLSGITGQTTVFAFILGNGLTNMVTPTSGMLLAYIAASKVSFGEWIRFILPLFAVLLILAVAALIIAVAIGY